MTEETTRRLKGPAPVRRGCVYPRCNVGSPSGAIHATRADQGRGESVISTLRNRCPRQRRCRDSSSHHRLQERCCRNRSSHHRLQRRRCGNSSSNHCLHRHRHRLRRLLRRSRNHRHTVLLASRATTCPGRETVMSDNQGGRELIAEPIDGACCRCRRTKPTLRRCL